MYLQRRDRRPDIANPGRITLFGGAAEAHETPVAAVIRELAEEVGLHVSVTDLHPLGFVDKREPDATLTRCHVFALSPRELTNVRVLEGAGFARAAPAELLDDPDLTPVARTALRRLLAGD